MTCSQAKRRTVHPSSGEGGVALAVAPEGARRPWNSNDSASTTSALRSRDRTADPSASAMTTWGRRSRPGTSRAIARSTDSNGFAARPDASGHAERLAATGVPHLRGQPPQLGRGDRAVPQGRVRDRERLVERQRPRAVDDGVCAVRRTPSHTSCGSMSRQRRSTPTRRTAATLRFAGTVTVGSNGWDLSSQPCAAAALAPVIDTGQPVRLTPCLVRGREGVAAPRVPDDLPAAECCRDPTARGEGHERPGVGHATAAREHLGHLAPRRLCLPSRYVATARPQDQRRRWPGGAASSQARNPVSASGLIATSSGPDGVLQVTMMCPEYSE